MVENFRPDLMQSLPIFSGENLKGVFLVCILKVVLSLSFCIRHIFLCLLRICSAGIVGKHDPHTNGGPSQWTDLKSSHVFSSMTAESTHGF
jgi:hypothetical protein